MTVTTVIEFLEVQGKRVRIARRFKNLTQAQLAQELVKLLGESFDDAKVSRIEKGAQDVTSRELSALSIILEQSRDWLAGEPDATFNDRVNPRYRDATVGPSSYIPSLAAA